MVTRIPVPRSERPRRAKPPVARGGASQAPTAEPWAAIQTALGAFGKRLPEMREDATCYAAVQVDRARLAVTEAWTRCATKVLQLVGVCAVLATAASLVVIGVMGGVAGLLGGNVWLANVLTGAVTLGVSIVVLAGHSRLLARRRMHRMMRRYERRYEARRDGAGRNGEASDLVNAG